MRIDYWNPEQHETVQSTRDYDEFLVDSPDFDTLTWKPHSQIRLYKDTENGLVVADIAKYETWLEVLDDVRHRVNALDGDSL